MAKGMGVEKVGRCVRTVIFMVGMVASMVVSYEAVVVAIGDVLVTFALASSITCLSCDGIKQHMQKYHFNTSLTDLPLLSFLRSFIIICVYWLCNGPALSHRLYLGTVTLCSILSVVLLSIKACVFSVNSGIEAEASLPSISKHGLHLNKYWGMPLLFLSSVLFAIAHTVIAYRTCGRARRKLMFHRVDPEAVLSCKNVFSSYHKVPRSPTPNPGRTPKSETELRRKPSCVDGELPARLLADIDSLFFSCQGLTVHYKRALPGSPPRSLSSTAFVEHNSSSAKTTVGRLKLDRPLSVITNGQLNLHRSYSNQFHSSSLYAPLLDVSPTSPVHSEDIPIFNLDDPVEEDEINKLNSGSIGLDGAENGLFGIVLVHGFGGGVFSWRHVMGVLTRQVGCTVAAFDRPGWGLTSRPRRTDWEDKDMPNPYKLETQVDLLLAFCSEMGFSSVVLVGHDDGGLLALMATQRVQTSKSTFNVSIKGVVLLNVSLSREVVPAFANILLNTTLGKKHLIRRLLRTEISQVVNRRAWYDSTKLTTEILNLYKAPLYVEGWDEAVHEISKLSRETVVSPQISSSLLKAVEKIPSLVIAGAEDALVPLKSSQAMASKLVNSRLVAISACGHLPHEECPKALLAAMTPFISRLLMKSDLEQQ